MSRRGTGEGTIYRRPNGRWCAQRYVTLASGARKRRTFYGETRAEVAQKLDAAASQEHQSIPFSERRWTVESYIDHWMNDIVPARCRPNTIKHYESAVRLYIVPQLGRVPLNNLSVADVQAAVERLRQSGLSPRTIIKFRSVLSIALVWAMREDIVFRNVAKLAEVPNYSRKPITPWTADEARRFLAAAETHPWYVGYLLLLTYGLRRGEAIGMRWRDIDFNAGKIKVRQQIYDVDGVTDAHDVKTRAGFRTLPLVGSVRSVLLAHAKSQEVNPYQWIEDDDTPGIDGLVLTKNGRPLLPQTFQRQFYKLAADADLPKTTIHRLRHCTATMLKNLRIPDKDIQLILGHANIATTQAIYQHADIEGQRRGISALEGLLTPPADRPGPSPAVPELAAGWKNCSTSSSTDGLRRASTASSAVAAARGITEADQDFCGAVRCLEAGGSNVELYHLIYTLSNLSASVIATLHKQAKWHTVGTVTAKTAVDFRSAVPLSLPKNELDLYQAVLTEKLRRACFPLNLLPTTRTPWSDRQP